MRLLIEGPLLAPRRGTPSSPEPNGEHYLITHFILGPHSRLTRVRAFLGELPTLISVGLGAERDLRPLPWEWFDLSDPERPVLTAEALP